MEKQTTSLKQTAYEYVKEKILSCEYRPGVFLNENQLCEEMGGISRTPVRDALSRLEQDGLVTIMPKRGVMVTEMRISDLNRIFEVRALLEPYALRKYGSRMDMDAMGRIYAQLRAPEAWEKEGDAEAMKNYYARDNEFHDIIISAMPNPHLRLLYETVGNLNRRFRVLTGNEVKDRVQKTNKEHLAIVEACIRQDWEAAAQAMQEHLEVSRQASMQLMVENEAIHF